jgi:predicted nucleic acid-binding protein
VDTTPIIALADIEQMDLLQKIYGEIVVLEGICGCMN